MTIIVKNKGRLIFDDFVFKCCIGKKGLTKRKVEGDKKTPKGIFELDNLYYRKDRKKRPKTNLKVIAIKKDMGWCDDINSKKYYNKIIKTNPNLKYENFIDMIISIILFYL